MGICAFFYLGNLFSAVVLHRSMSIRVRGDKSAWVYMHSSIYETYLV